MRASRPTIFLAVGVVLALLAALLVYATAQQAAQAPDPFADTTPIVVAVADIPERTVLTPEMLELRAYPTTLVPTGAIGSIDVAARQTTLVTIPAGAPLLATQVAAGGGATGYSLTLESGKVFVAFPVSDPLVTSGQVRPGDKVDILVTIDPGSLKAAIDAVPPSPVPTLEPGASPTPAPEPTLAPALPGPVTQTVVQNLEVVSIVGTNVLTFVVDHQTSLVLKNLRDSGLIIDLIIRSRAQTDTVQTKPVDGLYLLENYGFRQ